MDSLSSLIKLCKESDLKDLKLFLKQKNKRHDVKNLKLLNLIESDDINGLKKLYDSENNSDAYYALRKRLQDSVLLFLSQKTFESNHSESHEALRLLVVGRFLLENDLIKIAFKCLDKAERLAERLELFNLINELLLLKLQYAHMEGAEKLEALTDRLQKNQLKMQTEAKLNMAYAYLRQELRQIHLEGKIINLKLLLKTTVRKYKIAAQELMTHKSVYQILFIANEYAAIQQNYKLIERYVNRINHFISAQDHNQQTNLFYRISILYFIANFHLRQRNFDRSLSVLNEMMSLMAYDNRYNSLFYLRHQLLSGLNLFFKGDVSAATILTQDALSKVKPAAKPEDIDDLRLSLAMFLTFSNQKESLKYLALLTQTDAWYEKKMGMLWTIRKNLMEILVQAQFSHLDLALSRIQSFKRRYKKYLQQTAEQRVLDFLGLVEKYLLRPDIRSDQHFRMKVLLLQDLPENSDIFSLAFIAWLKSRWEKKSPYVILLDMIRTIDKTSH